MSVTVYVLQREAVLHNVAGKRNLLNLSPRRLARYIQVACVARKRHTFIQQWDTDVRQI